MKVAGAAKALGGYPKLFCVASAAVALVIFTEATPLSQDVFAKPRTADVELPSGIVQGDPSIDTTQFLRQVVA